MASQSELAYQKLRASILSAGVLPGQHLAEMDWATRLEVGRFAIREGLKRLHGEGLVTKNRGKYRVTVMTTDRIREITHLRAVLEIGALRYLTGKIRSRDLAAIRRAAKDYARMVRTKYYEGAREADLRFHTAIVAVSQNPRLIRVYETANLPLLQVPVGRGTLPLNDFEIAAREHLAITAAIEKNDIPKAAQLLEAHLRRGETEVTRS